MIGRIIGGFELVAFIGRGSFGSVYKCVKDNTNYAIKIFSIHISYSDKASCDRPLSSQYFRIIGMCFYNTHP